MSLVWEWEKKKDEWVTFDADAQRRLNEHEDELTVNIKVNESELSIDKQRMTSKNKTTAFQRRVRCALIDDTDGLRYCWQWMDNNKWHSYSPSVVIALEDAHKQDTSTIDVVIQQRAYTILLDKLVQMNATTNVEKMIRRVRSEAESAIVAMPAPSAMQTRSIAKRKPAEDNHPTTSNANGENMPKTRNRPPSKRQKNGDQTDDAAEEQKCTTEKNALEVKSTKRKLLVKGRAPVDPDCPITDAHVYWEGNAVYDVMLNQTNVQNNNNKYYLIQLLEDDSVKRYSVWMRWGRVGFKGQHSLLSCGPDLDQAKETFCKKFADKTKNEWSEKDNFKKVAGKYDMLHMDYTTAGKQEPEEEKEGDDQRKDKPSVPDSQLDERIQALLKLICDIRAMEDTVTELEYDANKAPLGKMTSAQIKAGYAALKKIEGCVESNDFGKKLVDAVNDYYTRIPHYFGMRQPPLIKNRQQIKKEMELLEALEDIEVAIRTLKSDTDTSISPIDRHYHSMKCDLTPLDNTDQQFSLVEKYLKATHAATHNTYKMSVKNVYAVEKHGEKEQFKEHLGNRMLLWHGSRLTNWYGILSQGLRIAPPEAPMTGYMFGKGVYFADMSSKSTNYCFATRAKPVGMVVLADVALGKTQDLMNADHKADKLTNGCHSTRGLGHTAPDPLGSVTLDDGCVVPCGQPTKTDISAALNYNEYVVYQTDQIRIRYLVEIDFQF